MKLRMNYTLKLLNSVELPSNSVEQGATLTNDSWLKKIQLFITT